MGSGLPSVSLPAPHSDGGGRGGVDAHASWSMAAVAVASAGGVGVGGWLSHPTWVYLWDYVVARERARRPMEALVKGAQVVFLHGADGELRG